MPDVAIFNSLTDFCDTWSKQEGKDDGKVLSYTAMIQYTAIKHMFEMIKENKFGHIDALLLRFAILVSRTTNPDKEDKSVSK